MVKDNPDDLNLVANYGWETAVGPGSCHYTAPKVIELLTALKVKRVADLGSGNGSLCGSLKARGFDVVGMEYDQQGCTIASQAYPDIRFYNLGVHANPDTLLQNEARFDVVVSTEVIEHLFSPHLLPGFARAILREHGFLIVSTPYHGYLKNLLLSLFNLWDRHLDPLWHGGHIKLWSKNTLARLFRENGFEIIGFHGVGRIPFLWKSMILVGRKA